MPENLAGGMTSSELVDLIAFLTSLNGDAERIAAFVQGDRPAPFAFSREPLAPELWPNRLHHVNRERVYDFYAKQADHFSRVDRHSPLLPEYPGLDGGVQGHWGNQSEDDWRDDRWNAVDVGNVLAGVASRENFRPASIRRRCATRPSGGMVSSDFRMCVTAFSTGSCRQGKRRRRGPTVRPRKEPIRSRITDIIALGRESFSLTALALPSISMRRGRKGANSAARLLPSIAIRSRGRCKAAPNSGRNRFASTGRWGRGVRMQSIRSRCRLPILGGCRSFAETMPS